MKIATYFPSNKVKKVFVFEFKLTAVWRFPGIREFSDCVGKLIRVPLESSFFSVVPFYNYVVVTTQGINGKTTI